MERGREAYRLLAQPVLDAAIPRAKNSLASSRDETEILGLKAYQYDIVCNGVELSSGAIRNHDPDVVMIKAFEIAGYARAETEAKFAGMLNAFRLGAPPHGGTAPGIDRIVMLLAEAENLRDVTMFPMNQQAEDLLMGAPGGVTAKQLKELHLKIVYPGEVNPTVIPAKAGTCLSPRPPNSWQ